jgi:L-glyceraldehyde 3-phosphate reductase
MLIDFAERHDLTNQEPSMPHAASQTRYTTMQYRRCGNSGLKLPLISLGLWWNFGGVDRYETGRKTVLAAFDSGVTHFDLANNYGPPPGSAEETFGRILASDLAPYRDELVVSTKAGYRMWPGPYGDCGSRKYLLASLDQSLKRMGLDYVDIFYHHCPDADTPLEESMTALDTAVRSGRALYAGISSYPPDLTRQAAGILRDLGTPCLIHQPSYSMLNRNIENGLLDAVAEEGIGCIPFAILSNGALTDRYFKGVPEDSRAERLSPRMKDRFTDAFLDKTRKLNDLAGERGQTLAQMAIAWVLRHNAVTTALCGASRPEQILDNVGAISNLDFTDDELKRIDTILESQ